MQRTTIGTLICYAANERYHTGTLRWLLDIGDYRQLRFVDIHLPERWQTIFQIDFGDKRKMNEMGNKDVNNMQ